MLPDLSPIEHVWDILGRIVQGHVPAHRNLQELANVLQEEWRRIPQNDIRRLVGSMRRSVRVLQLMVVKRDTDSKTEICEIW